MPMNSNVQIVHNSSSQKINAGNQLSDGSKVSLRVIGKNADGSYSVSLAGQKINVRSSLTMKAGQILSAQIEVKDGTVFLRIAGEKSINEALLQKFDGNLINGQLNQNTAEFLQSLGLEGNVETYRMLQFFKQMGLKFNVNQIKKALASGKKNAEKSLQAGELSILLENKDIVSDESVVNAVLYDRRENNSKEKRKNNTSVTQKHLELIEGEGFIKNFIQQLDDAAENKAYGIVTALNSLKNKEMNGYRTCSHWIIIPFEWPLMNAIGDIRFFYTDELKNLKKIVINCSENAQSSIFDLYFDKGKLKSLRFGFEKKLSDAQKNEYVVLLDSMLKKSGNEIDNISYVQYESLDGFCCDDEEIAVVRGLA